MNSLFPKYVSPLTHVALSLGKVDAKWRTHERIQGSGPGDKADWRQLKWASYYYCSHVTIHHQSYGPDLSGPPGRHDYLVSTQALLLSGHLCRCQDRHSPGNKACFPHTIHVPPLKLSMRSVKYLKCNFELDLLPTLTWPQGTRRAPSAAHSSWSICGISEQSAIPGVYKFSVSTLLYYHIVIFSLRYCNSSLYSAANTEFHSFIAFCLF